MMMRKTKQDSGNEGLEEVFAQGRRNLFLSSRWRTFLHLAILLASGGCMTLAFAPANVSFFAWVSVIPLLWLCFKATSKQAFLYGLVWGYAWHFTGTFFLSEIAFVVPFFFAVVLGLFNAVFASAVPFFCKNLLYPMEIRAADFDVRERFYRFPVSGEFAVTFGLATLWIALEWVRSWIFTGFPWNLLAASQYRNFSLIQICEYTGMFGVSFIVIFVNVAGFLALHGLRHSIPEGKYRRPFPLLFAIVLLIVVNSFGVTLYNRAQKMYADNASFCAVGVVQPHLSQRRAGTKSQSEEALAECSSLTRQLIYDEKSNADARAYLPNQSVPLSWQGEGSENSFNPLARKQFYPVQLIVWPETAVPCPYYFGTDFDAYLDKLRDSGVEKAQIDGFIKQYRPFAYQYRTTVRDLLKEAKVPFLIGSLSYGGGGELYNSALLLRDAKPKRGNYQYELFDKYDKIHIVPFGEFVPLAWKFPILDEWVGMGRSLTPGKEFRPLDVNPRFRVGTLVCYEDVFPYTAREMAQRDAQCMLVITNDAWYPTTSEPQQHCINSIFRTVETRLPMVRAGNSNFSVLINPFGQVSDCIFTKILADGSIQFNPERRGRGYGKFLVPVMNMPQKTFYTLHGDVFVFFCILIFVSLAGIVFLRKISFSHNIFKNKELNKNHGEDAEMAFPGQEKDCRDGCSDCEKK